MAVGKEVELRALSSSFHKRRPHPLLLSHPKCRSPPLLKMILSPSFLRIQNPKETWSWTQTRKEKRLTTRRRSLRTVLAQPGALLLPRGLLMIVLGQFFLRFVTRAACQLLQLQQRGLDESLRVRTREEKEISSSRTLLPFQLFSPQQCSR